MLDEIFEATSATMVETYQVVCEHIFLVSEEKVVESSITSPSSIKTCLHFNNLVLEPFQERQISLALKAELVDFDVHIL